jgi:GT2 family glycosyltransferase
VPPSPRISIIVPTWNNLRLLKLCLASIAQNSQLPYQVVVHINEGSDGTLQWIQQQGIEHTWTPQNVGICRGTNLAADQCSGDYFVYLNDDMYVLPGWDQALYQRLAQCADREPCFVSGTMIQGEPISPVAIKADYGTDIDLFQESRLLEDHRQGRLVCADWSGATWPPCGIHRKWWQSVGGFSEELFPGFYSDIDFSAKLWRAGCRRFWGIGASLVYHFGEKTTALVRGPRKRNVKTARAIFLKKWGMLPSTFRQYYLRAGEPLQTVLPEPPRVEPMWWNRARNWMSLAIGELG